MLCIILCMSKKPAVTDPIASDDSRNEGSCDAVVREDIRREILTYVTAGKDLHDVCERFGMSEETARDEIAKALQDLRKYNTLLTSNLRDIENARLEQALSAIWTNVKLGELDAVNTFVNLHKQRRELWGLSAPQKLALTDPSGENEAAPGFLNIHFVKPGQIENPVFDDTEAESDA